MMITTLDTMETYRHAERLAEEALEFATAYIAEVAADEPIEVQQMAIYIAGRLMAPMDGCAV